MPDDERIDVPTEDVEREIELAERMLADAKKAHEVDISKATVVNRLYYACFHAAQAVLYARGFNPRSHGRVQTLLGSELIQTGDVPRKHGRFFNDIETYRRRVDYGTGGVERNPMDLIEETAAFVDAMQALLDRE